MVKLFWLSKLQFFQFVTIYSKWRKSLILFSEALSKPCLDYFQLLRNDYSNTNQDS